VGTNIFSVDEDKKLTRHTFDEGAREIDFALDKQGNMVMSSNRVQSWTTYYNTPAKNNKNKIQYFNIFYLPAGGTEKHDKDRVAKAMTTSIEDQTIQSDISPDGRWVSALRNHQIENNKTREYLAIMDRSNGATLQEIDQADIVLSSQWSPDSSQLLYSTHTYGPEEGTKPDPASPAHEKALLKIYDVKTKTSQIILEDPWPNNQIASAQWAPNGEYISLIAHPLTEGQVRKLYVMNVKTHALTLLSADNAQVQSHVSWSNDSQQIVYGALIDYKQDWSDELREKTYVGSGQIIITNLKGEKRQITQGDKILNTRPTFSPDNQKIAYLYSDNLGADKLSLRVCDLQGKTLGTLYDSVDAASHLIWR
jgi:Tol biopolymer transport system component